MPLSSRWLRRSILYRGLIAVLLLNFITFLCATDVVDSDIPVPIPQDELEPSLMLDLFPDEDDYDPITRTLMKLGIIGRPKPELTYGTTTITPSASNALATLKSNLGDDPQPIVVVGRPLPGELVSHHLRLLVSWRILNLVLTKDQYADYSVVLSPSQSCSQISPYEQTYSPDIMSHSIPIRELAPCAGNTVILTVELVSHARVVATQSVRIKITGNLLANVYLGTGILSFICSLGAIIAFLKYPSLQRFPSNIVFIRSFVDLIFSMEMVALAITQLTGTLESVCNGAVAFLTQFCLLASLNWYFALTLNFHFSVSNPFRRPEDKMRWYHIFAWGGAIVTGIITATNPGFRPDLQLCWNKKHRDGINIWNWLGYFIWLLLFAFISVILFFQGRRRLQSSKLRLTLQTRERSLKHTRTYVAIFTIYWALAGSLWALVYWTTKQTDVVQEEWISILFAVVSGLFGFVDGFAWFYAHWGALKEIRARNAERMVAYKKELLRRELENDMSSPPPPPPNFSDDDFNENVQDISQALRREFILSTSNGIRLSMNHTKIERERFALEFELAMRPPFTPMTSGSAFKASRGSASPLTLQGATGPAISELQLSTGRTSITRSSAMSVGSQFELPHRSSISRKGDGAGYVAPTFHESGGNAPGRLSLSGTHSMSQPPIIEEDAEIPDVAINLPDRASSTPTALQSSSSLQAVMDHSSFNHSFSVRSQPTLGTMMQKRMRARSDCKIPLELRERLERDYVANTPVDEKYEYVWICLESKRASEVPLIIGDFDDDDEPGISKDKQWHDDPIDDPSNTSDANRYIPIEELTKKPDSPWKDTRAAKTALLSDYQEQKDEPGVMSSGAHAPVKLGPAKSRTMWNNTSRLRLDGSINAPPAEKPSDRNCGQWFLSSLADVLKSIGSLFSNMCCPQAPEETNAPRIFVAYAPHVFHRLRTHVWKIDDDEHAISMTADLSKMHQTFSEGASGSFLYFTHDNTYMVKTLTEDERLLLLRILPDYYMHMSKNPHSLICRFFGLYSIRMYSHTEYFVVMNNVLRNPLNPKNLVHERYDLKGSSINRYGKRKGSRRGANKNLQRVGADEVHRGTMKDNDLKKSIRIAGDMAKLLAEQLIEDSRFLRSHNIMDYSLLLGIYNAVRGESDNVGTSLSRSASSNSTSSRLSTVLEPGDGAPKSTSSILAGGASFGSPGVTFPTNNITPLTSADSTPSLTQTAGASGGTTILNTPTNSSSSIYTGPLKSPISVAATPVYPIAGTPTSTAQPTSTWVAAAAAAAAASAVNGIVGGNTSQPPATPPPTSGSIVSTPKSTLPGPAVPLTIPYPNQKVSTSSVLAAASGSNLGFGPESITGSAPSGLQDSPKTRGNVSIVGSPLGSIASSVSSSLFTSPSQHALGVTPSTGSLLALSQTDPTQLTPQQISDLQLQLQAEIQVQLQMQMQLQIQQQQLHLQQLQLLQLQQQSMEHNVANPFPTGVEAITFGPRAYFLGIIDVLQEWDMRKRMEQWLKIIFKCHCWDWQWLSAVDPDTYASRFEKMVNGLFDHYY